jgi:hypothetical protein
MSLRKVDICLQVHTVLVPKRQTSEICYLFLDLLKLPVSFIELAVVA